MGTFCGKFIDEHESTDDEGEKTVSKKKRSTRRLTRKKAPAVANPGGVGPSSTLAWAPYLSPIKVCVGKDAAHSGTQEFARLRVEKKTDISTGMLESMQQIQKLYAIEVLRCKLDTWPKGLSEMRDLHIIRFSHNEMTQFPPGKFNDLLQIQLDHNIIKSLDPAQFTEEDLNELTVLNLNTNLLQALPPDFGIGLKKLAYLDLSYNKLSCLPQNTRFFDCPMLEVLILSHNFLHYLPDNLGSLTALKKLFLSFNALTSLPDSIGECARLQKLRAVQNNIREMPATLLKLWQRRGGKLEELLIDRNPIIQPSSTAFEMGGLDAAMKQFAEHIEGNTSSIRVSFEPEEDFGGKLSLRASVVRGNNARRLSDPRATIASDDSILTDDFIGLPLRPTEVRPSSMLGDPRMTTQVDPRLSLQAEVPRQQSAASVVPRQQSAMSVAPDPRRTTQTAPREEFRLASKCSFKSSDEVPDSDEAEVAATDYYFSSKVPYDEIRAAESSILLLKKMTYVHELKKRANTKSDDMHHGTEVVSPMNAAQRAILDNPNLEAYAGDIPVIEIDLYLCLLVYVTKTLYSTIETLFGKFESGNKRYLSRQEWANFCTRIAINLPPHIEEKAWKLLAWRDEKYEQARIVDFIALWRCHDLEAKDSIIAGIAKVLNLKYYEMSQTNVSSRLHSATTSGEADWAPAVADNARSPTRMPNHYEGEKRISMNRNKNIVTDQPTDPRAPHSEHYNNAPVRASLTNQEYVQEQTMMQLNGDSDCDDSHVELGSSDLSDESPSSPSSLDKSSLGDATSQVGDDPKEEVKEEKCVVVASDGDLHGLMLSFEITDFAKQAHELRPRRRQEKVKAGKKKQAHAHIMKQVRDPRFKSDVVPVRKCIREVYRSRPPDEFFKLVNFLLRGLRYIKHAPPTQASYWHENDPIFANTINNGPYAIKLLEVMGFYKLANYWVWPASHIKVPTMNRRGSAVCWGDQEIPKDWIGRRPDRLDDMILLFKHCQKALHKTKGNFSGHF
eukprot:GEMP01005062.1.p1 GENE.GEMP01005062.1~~GEMP01005062.1.p1  ORF type:complete len:1011 (+),score=218.59 GEMP01005062.1:53-3085(+)